jgi:hypothetical protein
VFPFQAKHHWYNWGTYDCGEQITEKDIARQINKNAPPTVARGVLAGSPLAFTWSTNYSSTTYGSGSQTNVEKVREASILMEEKRCAE